MSKRFKVQKLLHDGSVKIEYTGTLRERTDEYISIDTGWSRDPLDLGYALMEPHDIWIETFYFNKNFNIFRIGDHQERLKGFYCNVTYPPDIEGDLIKWRDLAVDLWIAPDGSQLVLDEDEFEEIDPTEDERTMVKEAIAELRNMLKAGAGPFQELKES